MELDVPLQWLEATSLATTIRENDFLFPSIESLHVLAITLVVGSIAIVDLRLLGLASLDRAVNLLTREVLPYTWGAFAVGAITGALLFSSNAKAYAHNFFFQGKMILLVLAGINMLIFHLFAGREVERWSKAARPPVPAKIAGAVSLMLWVAVVGFGRWIGFTLH
jgi:hypothetical protein